MEGCSLLHLFFLLFCLTILFIFEGKVINMDKEQLWELDLEIYQFNLENNENE